MFSDGMKIIKFSHKRDDQTFSGEIAIVANVLMMTTWGGENFDTFQFGGGRYIQQTGTRRDRCMCVATTHSTCWDVDLDAMEQQVPDDLLTALAFWIADCVRFTEVVEAEKLLAELEAHFD